jgi:hypothetical protein
MNLVLCIASFVGPVALSIAAVVMTERRRVREADARRKWGSTIR